MSNQNKNPNQQKTMGLVHNWSRIFIGGSGRPQTTMDIADTAQRTLEEISAALPTSKNWILWGGEPTLRRDLPQLLKGISGLAKPTGAAVSMRTDGLSLRNEIIRHLQANGLKHVSIFLFSLRPDANDWLMGYKGATKKIVQNLKQMILVGTPIEIEIILTRSTAPHLVETIQRLFGLGVRHIRIRRLTANGRAKDSFITLSPRLALVRSFLQKAFTVAKKLGVLLSFEGIPTCFLPSGSTTYNVGYVGYDAPVNKDCPNCTSGCVGVGLDYTSRFGLMEFIEQKKSPTPILRLHFLSDEPTRNVRLRMVRLSQQNVSTMRITGDFNHPDVYDLIRESLRLSIPHIHLCGDLAPLLSLNPKQLLRLRKIATVNAALLGPTPDLHDKRIGQVGHFTKQMRVLKSFSGPQKGVYGVLKDPAEIDLYLQQQFLFPLDFRLASPGGRLSKIQEKGIIKNLLPVCLGGEEVVSFAENWKYIATHEKQRYHLDKQGSFASCNYKEECLVASRCVGIAEGWDPQGIKPQRNIQ